MHIFQISITYALRFSTAWIQEVKSASIFYTFCSENVPLYRNFESYSFIRHKSEFFPEPWKS
jgi:hypothetical protein